MDLTCRILPCMSTYILTDTFLDARRWLEKTGRKPFSRDLYVIRRPDLLRGVTFQAGDHVELVPGMVETPEWRDAMGVAGHTLTDLEEEEIYA